MITIDQFKQIELKVAKIVQAQDHPNADRLLVLTLDVGGVTKQVVAGIRGAYQAQDVIGKLVVLVDNLQPTMLRGVESQGMVLAAKGPEGLSLVSPERPIAPGGSVS